MKTIHVAYIPGQPWAICDRCGFKYRHAELRLEWTNLLVCDPCLDPLDPLLIPPKVWPEGIPINNPRPYPPPIFVETDITPEDL